MTVFANETSQAKPGKTHAAIDAALPQVGLQLNWCVFFSREEDRDLLTFTLQKCFGISFLSLIHFHLKDYLHIKKF